MMQHRPSCYEIERSALQRAGYDVGLAQLKVWRADVDQRQIQIDRDRCSAGAHSFGEPRGNGSVATSNFERARSWPDHIERVDVPAMHRIQ
jgi:hypothetical protein